MKAVVIQIPDDADAEDAADIVKHVGSQMEEGFTSGRVGYTTLNWSIEETE